jgi:hypothetical protein
MRAKRERRRYRLFKAPIKAYATAIRSTGQPRISTTDNGEKTKAPAGFQMSIAELNRVAASAPYRTRESSDAPAGSAVSENALVPVVAVPQRSPWQAHSHLPSGAPFLAHLIATVEQAPQTRTLRRATPIEAQAAYRPAAQNATPATGIWVRQSA